MAATRWSSVAGVLIGLLVGTDGTGGVGRAEAQGTAEQVRRAEPVVVTETLLGELQERSGASVTEVLEDVLRAHEYREVPEVLRTVPGVDVQTSGSSGKLTTVRIRGANPSQIQVLVDGVRVKSNTTGDFDFSNLTLDDIERVEVLRGPQATLYGADAIGGVVNIITKRGRGAPTGFVDVEGGNYETFRARVGGSGGHGPWGFSLGASYLSSGGQFENDDQTLPSVNGRITYALPNGGEISLIGRYSQNEIGIPFRTVFPDFDRNRQQKDTLALVSADWRQPWTSFYTSSLLVSAVEETLTFSDQPEPGQDFGFQSDISSGRREVVWLNSFTLGTRNTLVAGLEFRNEVGENTGTFSETVNSWALVAQDQLRLFDSLFITGGVRYDDSDAYASQVTGRVGVSYVITATDTRLKASWGQGYRAPTFNELFFPGFPPCPPFGNPNLQPEESDSYDAGVEQSLWGRRARVGATFFRNKFKNLIQAAVVDPVNFCFQAQNVGEAKSQGVEVEASVSPVDTVTMSLAYTYTDTEDLTTGQPLRRFPKNKVSVTATWEPVPGLTVFGELLHVSSQFEGQGLPENPPYTLVNAGASYRLPWRWRFLSDIVLHVRATNLFNENYSEVSGFPSLGTQVIGGLRATFN